MKVTAPLLARGAYIVPEQDVWKVFDTYFVDNQT